MTYIPIIGAYASVFELSVALSLTYAASKPFRDTMKSGFLYSLNKMSKWYDDSEKDTLNKITLMSDDDINQEQKKEIQRKFTEMVSVLREEDEKLSEEIEDSQSKIVNQIKPIYVYIAIFSLFILFLGGQEVAHQTFPIDGFNSLILGTSIALPIFYLLGFFNIVIPVAFSAITVFLVVCIGLFSPGVIYCIPVSPKLLVDVALVFAFLPFILSALRLSYLTLRLEIRHRWNYYQAGRELNKVNKEAEKLRSSREFFDNQ